MRGMQRGRNHDRPRNSELRWEIEAFTRKSNRHPGKPSIFVRTFAKEPFSKSDLAGSDSGSVGVLRPLTERLPSLVPGPTMRAWCAATTHDKSTNTRHRRTNKVAFGN